MSCTDPACLFGTFALVHADDALDVYTRGVLTHQTAGQLIGQH
ncbi:hypothetical protein [Amycolatopsis plumensis]